MASFAASPAYAAPFAAIIMDARTGETLWSQNADTRLHPASLTKMMTLYITFQEIESGRMSLDTEVTVTENAASQPPSRLGLRKGQKIKVRYLIRAAALKSANDAAAALGDHIGGSTAKFGQRMTKTARALGMKSSTFKNAHGLTVSGHLSTARDMSVLGRHLFYDFPQYYNIFSRRTADAGVAQVRSTNSRFLDSYDGADGIKTGYTVAAGFNLTASAKRGNVRLITTVFGGSSTAQRNAKVSELMNKGFDLAKRGVKERRPEPPAVAPADVEEELLASAAAPAAQQPAQQTAQQPALAAASQGMSASLRPRHRPNIAAPDTNAAVALAVAEAPPVIPDAVSQAIAQGVESALAEATAPPPPAGTLEAQVVAIAAGEPPVESPAPVVQEPVTLAKKAPAPKPDSFEAQAEALAAAVVSGGASDAQAGAADASAMAFLADGGAPMRSLRPLPRPERMLAAAEPAPAAEVQLAAAPPAPVLETVAVPQLAAAAQAAPAPVAQQAPQAVAMVPSAEIPFQVLESIPEGAQPAEAPSRRAPIFDTVQLAQAETGQEAAEDLVVVSKSTSGGASWAVAVGAYNSRYEAQRALLKTGLAESATLDQGMRKITEKGGKYRASFFGLTQDQADLACRRLRARGTSCETSGPA